MTVEQVHERIQQLLDERDWTGYKLAKECDISLSTFYNMMDRDTMPKIETLERMCEGFHITMQEFFATGESTGGDFSTKLTEDEIVLLEAFRRSDNIKRARILGFVEAVITE